MSEYLPITNATGARAEPRAVDQASNFGLDGLLELGFFDGSDGAELVMLVLTGGISSR